MLHSEVSSGPLLSVVLSRELLFTSTFLFLPTDSYVLFIALPLEIEVVILVQ